MADIGTIQDYVFNSDDWTRQHPDDRNILILPQLSEPTGPLVPLGPINRAWEYVDGPCAGGTCDILLHDAESGWWFLQAGVACDGVIEPSGYVVDVETYADSLINGGIDLASGQPFTPQCNLPVWARPIGWTECVWDAYTIACDDSLIVVTVQLPAGYTIPPTNPPNSCQCIGAHLQCCGVFNA